MNEAIRPLCRDDPELQDVCRELPRQASIAELAGIVIDYCDRRLLFDRLLARAREANPSRFDLCGPYLIASAGADPSTAEWASARKRYLSHVIDHHRNLSLFITHLYGGRVPPMAELEKVYVSLGLQSERNEGTLQRKERLADGAPFEPEGRMERLRPEWQTITETLTVGQAMARHRRLLVIGAPGSGKTTLLRWVALQYARGQAAEELGLDECATSGLPCLPIYLPLRDFGLYLEKRARRYGPPGPSALCDFIQWYFKQMKSLLCYARRDDFKFWYQKYIEMVTVSYPQLLQVRKLKKLLYQIYDLNDSIDLGLKT